MQDSICDANGVDPALMAKTNAKINRALSRDRNTDSSRRKLLLLGAGESGKSTLFKQMQVLHGGGYSDEERRSFLWIIHRNVIDAMKILIEMAQAFDYQISEENENRADRVMLWEADNMNPALAEDVDALWRDAAIKSTFERKAEFQLGDGASYFLCDVRLALDCIRYGIR